jgi:tetratricopeptide (TPR) repeat protein
MALIVAAMKHRDPCRKLRNPFPWVLMLMLATNWSFARAAETGTISGTVRNSSGTALAGVKITLTKEGSSVPIATTTSSDGRYTVGLLETGKYAVTAELQGFQPASRQNIDLTSRQNVAVDFTLAPAQLPGTTGGPQASKATGTQNSASYYEGSQLKPADFTGAIDPGGYSAPARAETTHRLLEGAAGLKNDSSARPKQRTEKPPGGQYISPAAIETKLKQAVDANPRSFEANHNLGEFYIQVGKLTHAVPYLEKAYHLDPSHQANAYDLALVYLEIQNLAAARQQIQAMLKRQDSAELHNLLAEVEERSGKYLEAVNEYQRAAQMDPTEQNVFDWGCELLLHRTADPAIEVFKYGVGRYPRTPKLWIGLGIALYSRGHYDEAVQAFLQATDLNPPDPRPYLFLAKAYNISTKEASEVTNRLKRYVELQPQSAEALYYYALSMWKGGRDRDLQAGLDQVESLLKKSAALDPAFPDVHLQLGILYADERKYPEAIQEYQQAIKLKPDLADAHYRLAQAYFRTGQKEQAQQEFEVHERLHKQQLAEAEKQRREVKQFVYSMKENSNPAP